MEIYNMRFSKVSISQYSWVWIFFIKLVLVIQSLNLAIDTYFKQIVYLHFQQLENWKELGNGDEKHQKQELTLNREPLSIRIL